MTTTTTFSWHVGDAFAVGGVLIVAAMTWSRMRIRKYKRDRPLPPGPKGFPLIGNMFDIPKESEWLTYADWGRKYGPVSYAETLGFRVVVLNSYQAVCDLFKERSFIYSGRMYGVMVNKWMGWDWLTSLLPYGDRLRKHRLLLSKYFQPAALKDYRDIQTQVAHHLIGHMLTTPEQFLEHIRSASGVTILSLVYGYDAGWENDPFVSLADEATQWLSKGVEPGAYMVDILPWLQYIPDWFPGTGWKRDGRTAHALTQAMVNKPFSVVKEKIGNVPTCMVSDALGNSIDNTGQYQDEDIIAEALATAYAGGSDTTVSVVQSTVLAFLLFPSVLERAQEKIDRVTGKARLPTFDDRDALPYIECIVREALRWNPVTPLGIPHNTSTDDIYKGYLIPADSTVIANQWAILHDEEMYPEPSMFKPERWLDKDGKLLPESVGPMHPNKIAFGFGRRICPGRYFAHDTAFIQIANIAAVFNITMVKGEDGKPIVPTGKYNSGILSHPEPFKCSISPRSSVSEGLIRKAVEALK